MAVAGFNWRGRALEPQKRRFPENMAISLPVGNGYASASFKDAAPVKGRETPNKTALQRR
jgi:hypothetical protein